LAVASALVVTGCSLNSRLRGARRIDPMALTIQLPVHEDQTDFNIHRWNELQQELELAPEICIELLSPSNGQAEENNRQ
jgi:Uma2 family endonuclease